MQTDNYLISRVVCVALLAITLTIVACNAPFPGPPEELPDCRFTPAFEHCTIPHDSVQRQIPFAR